MILGSIRVRKTHPLVRRLGAEGAARVMFAYGVAAVNPAKFYDVDWAWAYDMVPSNWISGWWTETYEEGLVHKIYGQHWTQQAVTEITMEDVRAARAHLASQIASRPRRNPAGQSAYPFHFDQSVLIPEDVSLRTREKIEKSITKAQGEGALPTSVQGDRFYHLGLLDPALMRPGSYVTRHQGRELTDTIGNAVGTVQVRSARLKPQFEREPLERKHNECKPPKGRERLVCREGYVGKHVGAWVATTTQEHEAVDPDQKRSIRQLASEYGKARMQVLGNPAYRPRRSK